MQGLSEQLAFLRDQNAGDPQLPVLERALRYHAAGDMRAAFSAFMAAANNGSLGGLQNAAFMVLNGLTDLSPAEAIPMLEAVVASERPLSTLACYQLGCLHISRRPAFGMNKDSTVGLQLLHRAAEFGSVQACMKLARLYAVGGRGVPRDPRLAAKYAARVAAEPKRRLPIQIASALGIAPIRDALARAFIMNHLSREARQLRRMPAARIAAHHRRSVVRKGAQLLEQQKTTLGVK